MESTENVLTCNQCGKKIVSQNGIYQEDFLEVKKEWGYFSEKDFVIHEFVLCEKCYDRMAEGFKIPVQKKRKTEI